MFRRVVLALAFVAALGAGGLGLASKADAHGGCGHGGGGYYGAYYPGYYSSYYGPQVSYYGSGFYGNPYGAYYPHHHHHSGVSFTIGF